MKRLKAGEDGTSQFLSTPFKYISLFQNIGSGSSLTSIGVHACWHSHAEAVGRWSICNRTGDLDTLVRLFWPNHDQAWTYDGALKFRPSAFPRMLPTYVPGCQDGRWPCRLGGLAGALASRLATRPAQAARPT